MEFEIEGLTDEQKTAIEKLVQSETDKVRTKYSQEKKDLESQLAQYKQPEKSEAEKALEARIKALEDKEKEISAKEKSLTIEKKMTEKGIPAELAKYLAVSDDKQDEAIDALSKFFLNESNVPSGHLSTSGAITKEQFKKMDYGQKAKLYRTNPDLYKLLNS